MELNTSLHVLHLNLLTSPRVLCLYLAFTHLLPLKLWCCGPLNDVIETGDKSELAFGQNKTRCTSTRPSVTPYPVPFRTLSDLRLRWSRCHFGSQTISLCCGFITRKSSYHLRVRAHVEAKLRFRAAERVSGRK